MTPAPARTAVPDTPASLRTGGPVLTGAPAALDAARAMAQSDPGGLWVTAFGYPTTAMLAAVLEELRPPGGALVQHRLGVGPWVHLQYSDWRQQQQALTKNGKVVQGVMIGVIAGIVPSSDILDLPSAPAGVGNLPLRVQHQRIGGPVLRAAAVGHRDLATTGWWTKWCEYAFGW